MVRRVSKFVDFAVFDLAGKFPVQTLQDPL